MSWWDSIFGNSSSSGGSSSGSIWPALISAGASLAGGYFTNQQHAQDTQTNIQMAQNKIDADKAAADLNYQHELELLKLKLAAGGSGGGSGASAQNAKTAALASLYNNWASNKYRGGADLGQGILDTGRNASAGLIAQIGALR